MTRKLIPLLFLLLLACCKGSQPSEEQKEPPAKEAKKSRADSIGMLVAAVQNNSRLYTSEFHIHKIISFQSLIGQRGHESGRGFEIIHDTDRLGSIQI